MMSYSIHEESSVRARGKEAFAADMDVHMRAKLHMQQFLLFPEVWKEIPLLYPLDWREVEFKKENTSLIVESKGVYVFSVRIFGNMVPPSGYITYVGKASNLQKRFKQYLDEEDYKGTSPRFHIAKMLNLWSNCISFIYATIENDTDEINVERALINGIHPPYNRKDFTGTYGKAIRDAFQ